MYIVNTYIKVKFDVGYFQWYVAMTKKITAFEDSNDMILCDFFCCEEWPKTDAVLMEKEAIGKKIDG